VSAMERHVSWPMPFIAEMPIAIEVGCVLENVMLMVEGLDHQNPS